MESVVPLSFIVLLFAIMVVITLAITFGLAYSKRAKQRQAPPAQENAPKGERRKIINHEILETKNCLKNEEDALERIHDEIKNLEDVFKDNQTNFISGTTRQRYEESMEQLKLRKKLRAAKIKFYQQYLKKWNVKEAIERAESLLLSEAEEQDGIEYKKVVQVEGGKQDEILRLRPLSERMKLCESEMEANLILKELEVLMKKH